MHTAVTRKQPPRINVRLPEWLHDDLVKCAQASGWDVSKQIRFELSTLRGKANSPILPTPEKPRRAA